MTAPTPKIGELTVELIPVESLALDPENPRLPPGLQGSEDQTELAVNMAEIFDALSVARSIARFGFYPWEALVVIPEGDQFVVVEGNRRLTAVLCLGDQSLRSQLDNPNGWAAAAELIEGEVPNELPCVVASDRSQATPALGYRHISGIKPWEPQMQARFVSALIDDDGLKFEQVAELVGQPRMWVEETYRNFKIFETAEEQGVDTGFAANSYSLLTVAMGTPELRKHIGAESSIKEGGKVIPDPDAEAISEVFQWVFGNEDAESVTTEGREIRRLAKVVGKPAGLKAIRDGKSLDEARQEVEDEEYDPTEVIRRDLSKAEQTLLGVDLAGIQPDDGIRDLVDAIVEQTQRLVNEIDAEDS